jgi:hypothetical protein
VKNKSVDRKVLLQDEYYRRQVELTDYPIIEDRDGVYRYEEKPITRWLCSQVNLNQMAIAYQGGQFSTAEFMQFYREIGYSLCGFEEIWGDEMDEMEEGGGKGEQSG